MPPEVVFTPSEFVAVLNQTLEYAYPSVIVEGELAEFRVSKNQWVYFKLKDEHSSVSFFGSVYRLPGPLQDGLSVRVVGAPRLHPRFGFSVSFESIAAVGEGSIKKLADLLAAKLEAEGLFAQSRKRALPFAPEQVGLITSEGSAAAADFIKVLNDRWAGVEVMLADSLVQGDQAPLQIVRAIELFNQLPELPEVLVIVRGGGSAEDLAAFNDERVVRAVGASRVPTLIAIGHEIDESLAELAADARASTPTAAATRLVPNKSEVVAQLLVEAKSLQNLTLQSIKEASEQARQSGLAISRRLNEVSASESARIESVGRILAALSPDAVLARGYALLSRGDVYVTSAGMVSIGDKLKARLHDGTINLKAEDS